MRLFLSLAVLCLLAGDALAQYGGRGRARSSGGCSSGSCAVAQTQTFQIQRSTVVQPPPVVTVTQQAPILIQERQTTVVRQASGYNSGASAYGAGRGGYGGGLLLRAPLFRLRIGY